MKKELKLPEFKNEEEEFKFWSNIDLSEYYESLDMVLVSFLNLKPTSLIKRDITKKTGSK